MVFTEVPVTEYVDDVDLPKSSWFPSCPAPPAPLWGLIPGYGKVRNWFHAKITNCFQLFL